MIKLITKLWSYRSTELMQHSKFSFVLENKSYTNIEGEMFFSCYF